MTKPIVDGLASRLAALVAPCSLGEVGLSDSDEDGLRRWAQIVSTREPRVLPTSFGLVFLALSTVIARKNAKEHRLWPFVCEAFREGARSAFFDQNQQPRTEVREAVEAATSTHGLRHVFDRNEGEQRWYLTVLLQCGWSAPALVNLPEWLAGRCLPRAMELLLDDPVLRSRSFADAFESLRALRDLRSNRSMMRGTSSLRTRSWSEASTSIHLGLVMTKCSPSGRQSTIMLGMGE